MFIKISLRQFGGFVNTIVGIYTKLDGMVAHWTCPLDARNKHSKHKTYKALLA